MSTAINKSSVTKTPVYKSSGPTVIWDSLTDPATETWDTIVGTWDGVGQIKTAVSKSSVTKSAINKS